MAGIVQNSNSLLTNYCISYLSLWNSTEFIGNSNR